MGGLETTGRLRIVEFFPPQSESGSNTGGPISKAGGGCLLVPTLVYGRKVRAVDGSFFGAGGYPIGEGSRSAPRPVFSARKIVRDFLHDTQRKAALSSNIVVEGRDTTTVVFPDAVRKIFLDASVEERAHRRYLQFKEKGIPVNLEDSRKNVIDRDMRDSSRLIAPLKKAPDALLIDSSNLSIEQVFRKIQEFIRDIS